LGKTKAILSALVEAILAVVLYALFDEVKRTLTLLSGTTISVGDATIGITVIVSIAVSTAVLAYATIDALRGKPKVKTGMLTPRSTRLDIFEAKINKPAFELGESVFFFVRFKGLVRYGYYEAVIIRPDRTLVYSWDPETLPFPRNETRGLLSGEIDQDSQSWSWPIPMNFPLGQYTARIGLYETYPLDRGTEIRARLLRNWALRKFLKKRDTDSVAAPERRCLWEKSVRFSVFSSTTQGSSI
jgi:hypothetical protein